jgi:hypothetical protein
MKAAHNVTCPHSIPQERMKILPLRSPAGVVTSGDHVGDLVQRAPPPDEKSIALTEL